MTQVTKSNSTVTLTIAKIDPKAAGIASPGKYYNKV
jgi:hypothetical protein